MNIIWRSTMHYDDVEVHIYIICDPLIKLLWDQATTWKGLTKWSQYSQHDLCQPYLA
jgi:hypothetical protein